MKFEKKICINNKIGNIFYQRIVKLDYVYILSYKSAKMRDVLI